MKKTRLTLEQKEASKANLSSCMKYPLKRNHIEEERILREKRKKQQKGPLG